MFGKRLSNKKYVRNFFNKTHVRQKCLTNGFDKKRSKLIFRKKYVQLKKCSTKRITTEKYLKKKPNINRQKNIQHTKNVRQKICSNTFKCLL